MRVAEALGIVDRSEEGGGGDGPMQGTERRRGTRGSWTARCSIRSSEYVSCRLSGPMTASSGPTTDSKRPGRGRPWTRWTKFSRTAGGDAVALLTEQGPEERDIARARPDHGVPDKQPAPHVPLGIGEAMGGAVRAEQARLRQGSGIAPVGLHLAGARRIHGREVRVRDDDLVAEGFETSGHPLAVGRGLDHNLGAGPSPEHGGEALWLRASPLLDHLTPIGEDEDLAIPLVYVDANMVHGWPLPSAALTARCSCGAAYATTSSERPAASSIFALCLRLQRGCGVRGWGRDGLGTGARGRGAEGVDVAFARYGRTELIASVS